MTASTPVRKPSPETLAKAHKEATVRGADCIRCPLGQHLYIGPVMGELRTNARLVIVGEAPGNFERVEGRPFVGPSGKVLNESLEVGGLERMDCTVTNVILCQPIGGDFQAYEKDLKLKHKKALEAFEAGTVPDPGVLYLPTDCCSPRLQRDLDESNSDFYLAVGAQALKSIASYLQLPYGKKPKRKKKIQTEAESNIDPATPKLVKQKEDLPLVKAISQQRGLPVVTPEGKVLVASYHPAFAMRQGSRQFMPVVRNDIAKAARIAVRGYVDWRRPKGIINPDIETVEEICQLFVDQDVEVTVDIETDGKDARKCRIRCIGLGADIDGKEVIIVVPFLHKGGVAWWDSEKIEARAKEAVRKVLNKCRLIGHNVVAYDSLVLLKHGFLDDRRKRLFCTLIADKNTDACDLPHRLEAVASRYFELPSWKISHDDDKYEDELSAEDDLEYFRYNRNDVSVTHKLKKKLYYRLAQCASLDQYEIDEKLAPIARDMGDLGLPYDMRRRMNIARILDTEISRREIEVKRIVKESTGRDEFNVRSNPQIGHFLYKDKGLIPLLNTKGEDWSEGESASAGSAALLKLLAKGADDETKKFIESILRFRAYEKQASTYSGRIAHEDDPKGTYKRGDLISGLPIDWEDYTKFGYGVLPVLHAVYKLHIASGRLAATPGIQTIPEVSRYSICYECLGLGGIASETCRVCKAKPCPKCGGGNVECPTCYGDGKTRCPMNLRAMFRAAPGHVLVGADFDALELRIITALAQDKLFLRLIREQMIPGRENDVHLYNYACLVGRNQQEIDKLYKEMIARGGKENKQIKVLRGYAKIYVFALAYGADPDKIFEFISTARNKSTGELEFPEFGKDPGAGLMKCKTWYHNFYKVHPELRAWQNKTVRDGRKVGYVATAVSGRKRFFPGGTEQANALLNGPIQGTAGDYTNESTVAIDEAIPFGSWSPLTGLILQVHDFLGGQYPKEREAEAKAIYKEKMSYMLKGVPITATPTSGVYWSDL